MIVEFTVLFIICVVALVVLYFTNTLCFIGSWAGFGCEEDTPSPVQAAPSPVKPSVPNVNGSPSPVPCSYTPSNAGCSATACGTSGVTRYKIAGFTAARNGGACPPLFGTPITGDGQVVNSTSPCSAPACAPSPVPCSYTPSNPTCSATPCGTSGVTRYTIAGFTPARNGGACPPLFGTPVTASGQVVNSTSPCSAPACAPSPVPCSYTPSNPTCSATPCGTSGVTQYTIAGFTAAQNGGACPPLFGTPITGTGQVVNSTSPCSAPACAPSSPCSYTTADVGCSSADLACGTPGVSQYMVTTFTPAQNGGACPPLFGTPVTAAMMDIYNSTSPCSIPCCITPWQVTSGNTCMIKKFKMVSSTGKYWYPSDDAPRSWRNMYNQSSTDQGYYFTYDPSSKNIDLYTSGNVYLGSFGYDGSGYQVLLGTTDVNNKQWTATPSGNRWAFVNDATGQYLSGTYPYSDTNSTWAITFV